MKVALIQMQVASSPGENLQTARAHLKDAAAGGADIAVLPEMFCCPYETPNFPRFAQKEGGEIWQALSDMAKENSLYLVAGSVPEDDGGKTYNTSYVFDPEGKCIAKHRKVHLFDIDVKGGQRFMESETLTAGDSLTTFDTPWGKMGLCICYDIRFPEWMRLMALEGAKAVFIPAAFNMTTGPAHWELSFRARALDNQIYLFGCAPARDMEASYHSWGHSIATNPWGEVMAQLDEAEGILFAHADFEREDAIRDQLPLLRHRRVDLYELRDIKK